MQIIEIGVKQRKHDKYSKKVRRSNTMQWNHLVQFGLHCISIAV